MRIVLIFLLLSALLDGSFSGKLVCVSSLVTWTNAQTYCRQHYTDLATINNVLENDEVGSTHETYVWIGLHQTSDSPAWVWSDQSNSTFSNWAPGEEVPYGSDLCGASKSGKWCSMQCDQQFTFFCYNATPPMSSTASPTSTMTPLTSSMAPPTSTITPPTSTMAPPPVKKTQILRLEVKSDENVNDPEVQKKVLEKIQHILDIKGLEGNATLWWRNQSNGNVFQKLQEYNVTQQICN